MNQTQRKFLIERIQTKTKEKIDALKAQKMDYPSKSNFLFQAIMAGKLELMPQDHIKEAIKKKALAAREGENWLSDDRMGWEKETTIRLTIEDVMVLPEELIKRRKEVSDHNKTINAQIDALKVQLETIEVRVQLASDKTLKSLINEVDDMGDLKLIDTTVKRLNQ